MDNNEIVQKIATLQERDLDDHSMKLLLIAQFHIKDGFIENAASLINTVEQRIRYK